MDTQISEGMGELLKLKAQRNAKMRTRGLTGKSFLPQEGVTIHLTDDPR